MCSEKLEGKHKLSLELFSVWQKLTSFREATVVLLIIIVGIILSLLSTHFLTTENLMPTAISFAADGIITVGMTIALVSGGLDFSVGSVMSLSGVVTGVLYLNGINIWISCIIGMLVGVLCGYINGFFIGKVGLNPFITTLAVMGIARGISYVLTQGSPISLFGVPEAFSYIGEGKILGFPIIVFIFIIIAFIGDFLMRRSEALRKVFYTGSNEKAAILSGINTTKVKANVYILVATLASLAGILTVARFSVATTTAGIGADESMKCITAAIIGGSSLSGGEGTIFGSVLGIILLSLINNGLILLNIPVYWQDLVSGVILIMAVTLDYFNHKNRIKSEKSRNIL